MSYNLTYPFLDLANTSALGVRQDEYDALRCTGRISVELGVLAAHDANPYA